MRVYAEVAKRSFRKHSTYRAATLAGLFTNTVFGFIQAYVMVAVFRARADVGGFDRADTLTWVFLTQALIGCLGVFGTVELADRVKTGDIVVDLYRPIDFQGYWLAADTGRALFGLVARGVPPMAVGALVFEMRMPSPAVAAAFLASLAIAMVVAFAWRFLVALLTFWIIDNRGVLQASTAVVIFFSGFILPLNFYPEWLRLACRAMPFSTMVQLPIETFLGKHTGADLADVLAYQALWAAALLVAGRAVMARAARRVEALGG